MKKQDTSSLRSSSYRQENSPSSNLQAKSIGCMSGIFHFIYKYSNRRRGKFITSGKKQEKNIIISTVPSSSSSSKQQEESNNNAIGSNNDDNNFTRITFDVPRSPTLPAEIRRKNYVVKKTAEVDFLEEAAEKKRKLIEALEKCDEDLQELKKIIDAVRSSVSVVNETNGDLQPSPVSVLDDFTPWSSALSSSNSSRCYANGRAVQRQKQKQKKKPGEEEDIITNMSNICLLEKMKSETTIQGKSSCCCVSDDEDITTTAVAMSPPMWGRSKAMIDSVNEVSNDIAWGERREIRRIGLALQDYICRDLIDDLVNELGSFPMYSLPFEACRRCLRF